MSYAVLISVDPDSPQADELRQLLNVVSGRAPDQRGRTSEPLVKEELAIVEFLTAKTNYKQAPSSDRPARGEDQTPVDLLLGLAKTRSGRRAAEEEKRQIRLQQYREVEEQRSAQQRGNGNMSSPWGYVAPSMPGLDVQQPFGAGMSHKSRGPRPLQPPPTKKQHGSWPEDLFDKLADDALKQPFGNAPPTRQEPSPQGSSFSQNGASFQLSPFASMSSLPMTSPNNVNTNLGNNVNGDMNNTNSLLEMFASSANNNSTGINESVAQFGQSLLDTFDFSDFNLGAGNAGGVSSSVLNLDGSTFNPFALPQQPSTDA